MTQHNYVTQLADFFTRRETQTVDFIKARSGSARLPCAHRLASAFFGVAEGCAKAYPACLCEVGKSDVEVALALVFRDKKHIMDESVQKSCWGLTAKAVIGFAGIILIAWLVSGADTAAVLAAG